MNTYTSSARVATSDAHPEESVPSGSGSADAEETSSDRQSIIITIDGPAGTGKSTVAHRLAQRLGLEYLDTGAMYRAASLIAIENDISPDDGPQLAEAIRRTTLRFDWQTSPPRLTIDGRDVSDRIRDMDVNSIVSIVSAQSAVRQVLVEQQREIANRHPRLVNEGRDQGSVVFPHASVRFFLKADVDVRARRRVEQLREAGKTVPHEQVAADIARRDDLDARRVVAPLICPKGAITIDTSSLTVDDVVDELEQVVRKVVTGADLKP